MSLLASTPESWDLQGIPLELREISAAAAVARNCGSIFNRKEHATLLDAAEAALGICIKGLPSWLRNIQLARNAAIHRAHMQRIKAPKIMQELDMFRLSGLATLVVLCARHSEEEDMIARILELLLAGELGTVVKVDKDRHPTPPYTFQQHIVRFISSTLDADRDSDVSRLAAGWMAQLSTFGGLGEVSSEFFARRQQESIDLIGELLGAAGSEDDLAREGRQDGGGWARIHDTLHLTSAYIALAASAHGASVVVECISDHGSKMFPREPTMEEERSAFLVRLWLTQPPDSVRGILRGRSSLAGAGNSRNGDPIPLIVTTEEVVVTGGTLELAVVVAKKLNFRCRLSETDEVEGVLNLWRRGAKYGQKLRWVAKRKMSTAEFGKLLLVIKAPSKKPRLAPQAVSLYEALKKADTRVRPLARGVAKIAHDFYGLEDYASALEDDENGDKPEVIKAMLFILVSISVEALHNTTNPASEMTDSYALNLATLSDDIEARGPGNLYWLFRSALNKGIPLCELLATAATLWGGATVDAWDILESDELVGIVAPRCTVIFDILRDPLAVVSEDGIQHNLLSIWRGAVPMLPRDPLTGCLYSVYNFDWDISEVNSDYTPKGSLSEHQGPLLVTFEPSNRNPAYGVFCFWYGGVLIAEVDPHSILTLILSGSDSALTEVNRTAHDGKEEEGKEKDGKEKDGKEKDSSSCLELSKADLLHLGRFSPKDLVKVVIKGLGDPAWSLFAVGCCLGLRTVDMRLSIGVYRGEAHALNEELLDGKFEDRRVIVVMN